jgi:AraC-like DNA-binding protein
MTGAANEDRTAAPKTTAHAANRYDRFDLGPTLVAWEYEFTNNAPLGVTGMATGLEIDVQLTGEWGHRGARSGSAVYGPGEICTISPSEVYSTSYRARGASGLQVGFIFHPEHDEAFRDADGALVVPAGRGLTDRRFVEFCRAWHFANETGAALDPRTVHAEVRGFVARHAVLAPLDPVLRAKRELDRTFNRALYMRHVAEIAGMHETTFGRRFLAKFGVSPSRYRLLLRLNEAARQTSAMPERTVAQIAAHVGFDDLSYFHRAFRAQFGTTPSAYPRRYRTKLGRLGG